MTTTVLSTDGFVIGTETDYSTRCIDCGMGYSDEIMDKMCQIFNLGKTVNCRKCGKTYSNIAEFEIWVRHDAAKFFNVDTVRKTRWFHATDNPNWFEEIRNGGNVKSDYYGQGDVMVHLGIKDSALARAEQRHDEFISCYGVEIPQWYLYEVELKTDIEIFPEMQDDEDGFPSNSAAPEDMYTDGFEWSPQGVTRYVNAFEQPGSISLLANAHTFNLVAQHEI